MKIQRRRVYGQVTKTQTWPSKQQQQQEVKKENPKKQKKHQK